MSKTTSPSPFAKQLRAELTRQNVSIRSLAKRMNPEEPNVARRNVYRWLAGTSAPSPASREAVAQALGLPLDHFASDDEEEDALAALMTGLRALVREVAREGAAA